MSVRAALLGIAMAIATVTTPASAAVFYRLYADSQGSSTPLTLEGTLRLESAGSAITDLSVTLSTFGSMFADPNIDLPMTYVFNYDEADVVSVTDLLGTASGLDGSIQFDIQSSAMGSAVTIGAFGGMDALLLDFTAGMVSGFCFDSIGTAQCFAGGGTSTFFDVPLETTVVPLPATAALLVGGLAALAGLRGLRSHD